MTKEDYKKANEINLNKKEKVYLDDFPNGTTLIKVKLGRKYIYYMEIQKNACSCAVQRFDFFQKFPDCKYGKNLISVIFHKDYNDKIGGFYGLCLDKDFILKFDEIVHLYRLKKKYKLLDQYL